MMSNLSVRRREGELVRSLGADEIKRDDLAIHASARPDDDDGGVTHSVRVHFFGPNGSSNNQFKYFEAQFSMKASRYVESATAPKYLLEL